MKRVFIILFFLLCPVLILAEEQIDINTASLQQLDEITGIGPVMAQRIIDARPFSSVDDLERVKGIGPKTLQKIKDQGLACVGCGQTQQPAQAVNATLLPAPPPAPAPAPPVTPVVYPGGVFINEILPSPEGADETEEWIELYNSNNFEVDLNGWKIEDTAGTKASFLINKKISANEYLVLKRTETKISLNNTEDGLNLFWPDNKMVDSMSYKNAPRFQSYNKANSNWSWSTALTPGKLNTIVLASTQNSKNSLSKTKNSVNNNLVAGLSDAIEPKGEEKIKTKSSPWLLFFVALAITTASATAVLFIKLKFKNHVRT